MINFIRIGKAIYNLENWWECRRMVVFVLRAYIHYSVMKKLYDFFVLDTDKRKFIKVNKYPLEQVTRAFFYNKSTMHERMDIIKDHISFLLE